MLRHKAKVISGALQLDNSERFLKDLVKYEGKDVSVEIKRYRKQRSNNQNRYLWGCVYKIISDWSGNSSETIHDAMRMKFLIDHSGKFDTIKSTKELSTKEFEDYVSKIRQYFSLEFSVYIPLPHETKYY